jgi:hypothetical protein
MQTMLQLKALVLACYICLYKKLTRIHRIHFKFNISIFIVKICLTPVIKYLSPQNIAMLTKKYNYH